MAILKVTCPGCAAVLKSGKPDGWAAGTNVNCPKCKQSFAAAEPAPAPKAKVVAVAAAVPAKKAQKAKPVEDDEDDDRPAKKKGGRKGEKPGPSSKAAWAVRGVVTVVLLVACVVVWGVVAERARQNAEVDAENQRIAERNAAIAAEEANLSKPITPDQIKKAAGK